MTSQGELWPVVLQSLQSGGWVHVNEIYDHVQQHVRLDQEDLQDHAEGSEFPRWKRTALHALYYHKTKGRKTGKIQWQGGRTGLYRLNN